MIEESNNIKKSLFTFVFFYYFTAFFSESDWPPRPGARSVPWLAGCSCTPLTLISAAAGHYSPPWPILSLFAETMSKRGKQNSTPN